MNKQESNIVLDIISNNPIIFIVVEVVILAIILLLVFKGKDLNIFGFEIKNKKEEMPKNINKGVNNGIIGDNGKIIKVNENKIELNELNKSRILKLINKISSENNNVKKTKVTADLGNPRSEKLAELIRLFLLDNGFDAGKGISRAVSLKPSDGVNINFENDIINVRVFSV
jgi:hypothetical protein